MKGILSQPKRDYVLFHLSHHLHLSAEISSSFLFSEEMPAADVHGKIIFLLSSMPLEHRVIRSIDGVPVLFPLSGESKAYHIDERSNLIFNHDFLKSIFFLLSGQQEYENQKSKDRLGRFAYEDSIQSSLNIIGKPVVNYYFKILTEGIELFCRHQQIPFKAKMLFENFGFLLTHDIDYIDCYTPNYFIYKLKEVLGLKPSSLSRWQNVKLGLSGFLKYTGILKNDNPFWNFQYLRSLERDSNFKSVFYFLDQGVKHSDAAYSFDEPRVRELFKYLTDEGCEIGLHGPVQSVTSLEKMKSSFLKLQRASKAEIIGIRQHRLLWRHPFTALIQKDAGLRYDTTLGFAAHEGFRNSYAHPFKLYDFEKDAPVDLWEFPMTAMDVTLFGYRKYKPKEALEHCKVVVNEIQKFGGLFTLIWHNSFFDEVTYPGVTKFYSDLLKTLNSMGAENLLGKDLLNRMEKNS